MRGVKDPQIVNLEAGAVVPGALVHKAVFSSTSRISVAPSFSREKGPQMGRPFAGQ